MNGVIEAIAAFVDGGRVPSASVVVRVDGREVFHHSRGWAAPNRPVIEDQVYDLASVTKVVVGASVAAALLEEGVLSLEEPVVRLLSDVDPRITLRHLLTHSSGYPAWRPLYSEVDAWGYPEARAAILRLARQTPLESSPGERHIYSDLGFLVLLQVLEAASGEPIEQLFQRHVLAKSGADLRWGWPGAAATEICPVRNKTVVGEVHDLNCLSMGGVSTHAGLFAAARGLARWAEWSLDEVRTGTSRGHAIAALWSTTGPGSHRGGWDGISPGASSTGRHFPTDTVGHLGYTGTSVWVVPSRRTVVALLTNRVHPHDDKVAIREMRPQVHDSIATALGWAR